MSQETYDYDVKCKTCRKTFTVQLFDSHECKNDYFQAETDKRNLEQKEIGFSELTGTAKTISWATKIREEMINKVNYLKQSLSFDDEEDKVVSDKAFEVFFSEWYEQTTAKWWIDNRRMNVRDISTRIAEITKEAKSS